MITNISNSSQISSQQKSNMSFGNTMHSIVKGLKPSQLGDGEEKFLLETFNILLKNGDLAKSKINLSEAGDTLLISVAGTPEKFIISPKNMPRGNKNLYNSLLKLIGTNSQ